VTREGWSVVTTEDELVDVVGVPHPKVAAKVRTRLAEPDLLWLAASTLCLVATSDAGGRCDVSPKGDPAGGLVHVLDDRTLVLADRPGNRRVDGFRNVLANPHVGALFLVPGRSDALRVNGRALVVREAPFLDDLVVRGHRPSLALVVEVEEVFLHCAKALLRSGAWDPAGWRPDALPSSAALLKATLDLDEPLEVLEDLEAQVPQHLYG